MNRSVRPPSAGFPFEYTEALTRRELLLPLSMARSGRAKRASGDVQGAKQLRAEAVSR